MAAGGLLAQYRQLYGRMEQAWRQWCELQVSAFYRHASEAGCVAAASSSGIRCRRPRLWQDISLRMAGYVLGIGRCLGSAARVRRA